jgi:CheY-like chemotaxis protein
VPSVERPPRRRIVLVVEDDADLRRIFSDALKFAGFEVREASDGPAALRAIENSRPDVVVLDVRLPTLDGGSVREEIVANPETRNIPIVMVTGIAGFDGHGALVLQKPVSPQDLVAVVRRLATFGSWEQFGNNSAQTRGKTEE